ncbi:MAG: hypothetical protein AAGA77_15985 [Bacteroidota bacterium]
MTISAWSTLNTIVYWRQADQANEEIDLFLNYIKADAERQFMTARVLANPGQFPCNGAVIDLQAAFFSSACTQS